QAVITPHPLLVALVRHPVDQNCVRELIRHRLQLLPERTSQHLVGDGQRCCLTLREAPHRKRPTQHPLHLLDRSPHFILGKQRGVLHHAHRGLLCWLLHHNQLTKEPHLSAQGFSRIHGRTSAYTPGRSSVSHPRPSSLELFYDVKWIKPVSRLLPANSTGKSERSEQRDKHAFNKS